MCGGIICIFYKASLMVIMSQLPLGITGYPIIMDCSVSLPDLSAVAKVVWLWEANRSGSCDDVMPSIRYVRAHTKRKARSHLKMHLCEWNGPPKLSYNMNADCLEGSVGVPMNGSKRCVIFFLSLGLCSWLWNTDITQSVLYLHIKIGTIWGVGVVLCTALNSGRSQDQVNHYGSWDFQHGP